MWVQSLGLKDPLEKGMKTHSIILAWRILWTEEPCGLESMGSQRLDMTEATSHAHTHTHCLSIVRICLNLLEDLNSGSWCISPCFLTP